MQVGIRSTDDRVWRFCWSSAFRRYPTRGFRISFSSTREHGDLRSSTPAGSGDPPSTTCTVRERRLRVSNRNVQPAWLERGPINDDCTAAKCSTIVPRRRGGSTGHWGSWHGLYRPRLSPGSYPMMTSRDQSIRHMKWPRYGACRMCTLRSRRFSTIKWYRHQQSTTSHRPRARSSSKVRGILAQKPMAMTYGEARRLVLALQRRRSGAAGQPEHAGGSVRALKRLLDRGSWASGSWRRSS